MLYVRRAAYRRFDAVLKGWWQEEQAGGACELLFRPRRTAAKRAGAQGPDRLLAGELFGLHICCIHERSRAALSCATGDSSILISLVSLWLKRGTFFACTLMRRSQRAGAQGCRLYVGTLNAQRSRRAAASQHRAKRRGAACRARARTMAALSPRSAHRTPPPADMVQRGAACRARARTAVVLTPRNPRGLAAG